MHYTKPILAAFVIATYVSGCNSCDVPGSDCPNKANVPESVIDSSGTKKPQPLQPTEPQDCAIVATYRLVSKMTCEDAIHYCRSMDVRKPEWPGAFMALECFKRKDLILPYAEELLATKNKVAKYYCYRLACSCKWPEFYQSALEDVYDPTAISQLNPSPDELTLGSMARIYLRSIAYNGFIPAGAQEPQPFIVPPFEKGN